MAEETGTIEAKGLYHRYELGDKESVVALAGVDASVKRGEFVAIIGPNGSGKSTLAKHFNVLLLPEAGDVLVFGMNTKDEGLTWEIRRNAGMVFQNPDNQIVATVVEEDVAFGPENLGVEPSAIRDRVRESLAAVEMEGLRRHAPHLLSGGQKQRVAIAGVLAMRPKCIILDEPTAMLDPRGREEVMKTVLELNRKHGITIIHITHYMDEALYADRVLVMDRGKVVMEGTPREVFQEREKLVELGLDVPPLGRLAEALDRAGIHVRPDALSVEELVEELCRLKSGI
ncbi:MAG: energy-coupling factor transporter ATPase [Bacillota bacterium]|jgi:energy-coupling factor transport system ATP-binding protein